MAQYCGTPDLTEANHKRIQALGTYAQEVHMFRMSMPGRTMRAIAAGALTFSLAATTFVGSANAAPLANNEACSAAAQVRTDAVHALHDAWKASTSDLKSASSASMRHELIGAWRGLKTVILQAIQDLKDLGLTAGCAGEGTTPTDTTALDQQVKAIVDKATLDLQAIVTAARTAAADEAAAAPKDSTDGANDENGNDDKDSSDGPKDTTGSANDEDKDSHDENVNNDHEDGQDRDVDNEGENDDHDNSNQKSRVTNAANAAGSTKATNAKLTNAGRAKSTTRNRSGHRHESD
jgi:hypothetical protein